MKPLGWPRLDQDGNCTYARIASRATEVRRARAEIDASLAGDLSDAEIRLIEDAALELERADTLGLLRETAADRCVRPLHCGHPECYDRAVAARDAVALARTLDRRIASGILDWIIPTRAAREAADLPLTYRLEISQ